MNRIKSFAWPFGTSAEVLRRALWGNSAVCRVVPQTDLSLLHQRFPRPMKSYSCLSFLSLRCFYRSFPAESDLCELLVFGDREGAGKG